MSAKYGGQASTCVTVTVHKSITATSCVTNKGSSPTGCRWQLLQTDDVPRLVGGQPVPAPADDRDAYDRKEHRHIDWEDLCLTT